MVPQVHVDKPVGVIIWLWYFGYYPFVAVVPWLIPLESKVKTMIMFFPFRGLFCLCNLLKKNKVQGRKKVKRKCRIFYSVHFNQWSVTKRGFLRSEKAMMIWEYRAQGNHILTLRRKRHKQANQLIYDKWINVINKIRTSYYYKST